MENWELASQDVLKTRDGFVADKLREAIQQGYFEPGQKLDQHEIAELLNVSRSPVREALRTLAAEGLVEFYPHRGAVVVELSLRELEEIFLMRAV
ncbi:MAG TPA: GntR family transcriptional regulator, partial [Anaerolineae bacterium]